MTSFTESARKSETSMPAATDPARSEVAHGPRTRVIMFAGVGLAGLEAAHRLLIDLPSSRSPVLVSIRDVHPDAVWARADLLDLGLAHDGDALASSSQWFIAPDRYCSIEHGRFHIDRWSIPQHDSPVSARLCESLRHEFGSRACIVMADPLLIDNVFMARFVRRGGQVVPILSAETGAIDDAAYDRFVASMSGQLGQVQHGRPLVGRLQEAGAP